MAVLKRIYRPLKATISMITIDSQLAQEYDTDNDIFYPDRRIVPTVIQPILHVHDPSGLIPSEVIYDENGVLIKDERQKNEEISTDSLNWYINTISEDNRIKDDNSDFKIYKGKDRNRGRITVFCNTPDTNPIRLIFEGTYYDTVTINGVSKVRRKVPFQGAITLVSNIKAKTPIELKKYYPRGQFRTPLSEHPKLSMSVGLHDGVEFIPAAHWWYKKTGKGDSTTYSLIGSDYAGYNTNMLRIPIEDVGKENHYTVVIQDCREDLEKIKKQFYIDNEETYKDNLGELREIVKNMKLELGFRPSEWGDGAPDPKNLTVNNAELPVEAYKLFSDDLILATKYPSYTYRVNTEHGDDGSIITIPSHVDTFDAWVDFSTPKGDVKEELAGEFWDVDWGNGKKGIRQSFNADEIGLGFYTLEPKITEKIK